MNGRPRDQPDLSDASAPDDGARPDDAPSTVPLPTVADADVPGLIEALLLVAPGAIPLGDLARATGLEVGRIEMAMRELAGRYNQGSGLAIQRHGETVQLMSATRFAAHVRRFLRLDRETRLSPAAMETLAIIAYQQPTTRSEVDAVRGVDSSGVLATLHGRGLIEQVGRLSTPGNPVQYGTSAEFLRHFGLRSLEDLPPLGQVEGADAREALAAAAAASAHAEAPAAESLSGREEPRSDSVGSSDAAGGSRGGVGEGLSPGTDLQEDSCGY